jgi:DNA repair protein RecO (recombination protein O)
MPERPELAATHERRRRNAPVFSDVGIVLRSHKLGEADKIIRVLTREHGKRSAVAKGVRKTTSRFGARLEPFTCARLLVHRGRSLDIVRQAEIETSFHELREDIDAFVHASAMAELVDGITQEHEPHPELFDLLLCGLDLLKEHPGRAMFLVAFFEFRTLAAAGFELRAGQCAACGVPVAAGGASFSLSLGGLVCERCRGGAREDIGKLVRIGAPAARTLAWMPSHGLGDWPEQPPGESASRELRLLMDMVVEHWMEREFRSHRVMKTMP